MGKILRISFSLLVFGDQKIGSTKIKIPFLLEENVFMGIYLEVLEKSLLKILNEEH